MNTMSKISKTKAYLNKILYGHNFRAEAAVIAGSGLGQIKEELEIIKTVKYSKIPYFAKTTVPGHAGELNFCKSKGGTNFLIFNGRFHYYEGHGAQDVIYPVRVMNALGIKTVIITAAVGGMNKKYNVGDIVFLKDHINFTGNNPLMGANIDEIGERFPAVTDVYDLNFRNKALKIAKKLKIKVREGIYFSVSGPSYETAAEVEAYVKLGGDVVGMSVVYEAIAAAHMKMKVLGIAYVSNMAAGISKTAINHEEVLEAGKKAGNSIRKIIKEFLEGFK
ncbi:MAG: purine-nucleoside phosphorylase [Endomicrobia bacterium]|nr:purine-nucleoside phosphorylase [Endomicrobiia bacterium]